ncbi:hypothetical protein P3T23_008081 [Paraburkholderia sp. GAS448]|uniref:hypothetical protein n=1 Tax=Paraburkholderia sp. GAS448 TaxID=3035136 RepID=UPI003D218706
MEFVKLHEAIGTAEHAADAYGLPQTVFRSRDTHGWANTNALARVLGQAGIDIFMTVLPTRYFS